ncbi:DrmB family protein [Peribacillus sp. NPDC097197]|uniref:DrmB family protein n=1 Tax=Peribacillus sp. NPDC097197 TaxID=3390615 RepID=UPI003D06B656
MSQQTETIRPSQLIYQSGPGAIVELLNQSVIVKSADQWQTSRAPQEKDARITSFLKVDHVRILNENPDKQKIKAVTFPKWKICPKCQSMTDFNNTTCYYCAQKNTEDLQELYASRFVLVCEEGHISDFPYEEWVHRKKPCSENSKHPRLVLKTRGKSGSLSDLHVICLHCNQSESLGRIMHPEEREAYSLFDCKGDRPWISPTANKKCSCKMKTTLRGASNVYSPSVMSFLQVPLTESSSVFDILYLVEKDKDNFSKAYLGMGESGLEMACNFKGIPSSFIPIIKRYLDGEISLEESSTYETIKKQEWNTLTQDEIDVERFLSKKVAIAPALTPYFDGIYRVDSVPAVQVLKEFTRLDYIDRFTDDEVKTQPVVITGEPKWLPAVRNYGEGIFFKLNEDKLLKWEQSEQVTKAIIQAYNTSRVEFKKEPLDILPRQILLHTFSHALLQELAAHCGYTTTSLKERIYASEDMFGVFIYTASGDSEGSLGGLTNLAQSEKLLPIIIRALEKMSYCSSDPICSDGEFEYHTTANGAACHACTFVSETSCEWGNLLLDRRTLININPNEQDGYFDQLLEM